MKRFTTEGTNDQEGLGLIPAQRRAEEEPLGLSFEGGGAGARRYSRRQALGLLGGSLAGVSLLSFGLAAPAKAGPVVGIKYNDIITLKCLGEAPGPRYLDGRTANGTVGLAPHTNPPYSGTRWNLGAVDEVSTTTGNKGWYYYLYCKGTGPGDARYLDGRTVVGDVVLSPHLGKPFTGTHWQIDLVPVDKYGDPLPQ